MTSGNGMQAPTPPPHDASIERDLGLPVKTCPGCRTANQPGSQYCYKCGVKLPEQAGMPALQPAGFWRRFGAYIIDNIFIGISSMVMFTIIFSIVFAISPEMADQYTLTGSTWDDILAASQLELTGFDWLMYGLGLVFDIAYWTILVGWKGQSVGKMMLGMKVVRVDGSRVGYGRAFMRYWGYALCWLTFGLGFLAIAWSKEKRGLHDLACDTMVIKA